MLKLSGLLIQSQRAVAESALLTVTSDPSLPLAIRERFALLADHPVEIAGYGCQLVSDGMNEANPSCLTPQSTGYLLTSIT